MTKSSAPPRERPEDGGDVNLPMIQCPNELSQFPLIKCPNQILKLQIDNPQMLSFPDAPAATSHAISHRIPPPQRPAFR
jgi:hypothetical protein